MECKGHSLLNIEMKAKINVKLKVLSNLEKSFKFVNL